MRSVSTAEFEAERPRLRAIAYSILGSLADAEDAVQEAWLRWERQPAGSVRSPRDWLATVVTRISLDEWGSARRRREAYVGEWLPEPDVGPLDASADAAATADEVELALLVVLERLSPAERAAFVLCDVFGYAAPEAAAALDRTPAAVRQLASRARRHVREARPERPVDRVRHRRTVDAFAAACEGRDIDRLMTLLDEDVTFVSDGGGRVKAAGRPLLGRERVAGALAAFAGTLDRRGEAVDIATVTVNGEAGMLVRSDGLLTVFALESRGGRITALRAIRNPDKLAGVYRSERELLPG